MGQKEHCRAERGWPKEKGETILMVPAKPAFTTIVTKYQQQKFSDLLKLPQNLAIVTAHILFLRLTVPADLYNSGILVEIEGLRIRLNADLENQEVAQGTHQRDDSGRLGKPSKGVKADKPRSNQSHVHDPGGLPIYGSPSSPNEKDDGQLGDLPSTVDLAKSFLQTDPREEKAELQASVTNSQYLNESRLSSEDGDVGVGNNVLLPAFLADFLKGVGDRVQLAIHDVEVDLILKVDRFSETASGSDVSDRFDPVTLRLAIEDLCLEGMDEHGQTVEAHSEEVREVTRQETRRVTFSNVQTMVISEASLFADLARSTAPSSPETKHTNPMAKAHSRSGPVLGSNPSTDQDSLRRSVNPDRSMEDSRDLESAITYDGCEKDLATTGTEDKSNVTLSLPYLTSKSEFYDRTFVDSLHSSKERNRDEQHPLADSKTLPASMLYGDPASSKVSYPSPTDPYRQHPIPDFLNEVPTPTSSHFFAPDLILDREKEPCHASSPQAQYGMDIRPVEKSSFSSVSQHTSPISTRSPPDSEDLAESKIFTREEASVYMSAISQPTAGRENKRVDIPGDWDSSSSDCKQANSTLSDIVKASKSLRHDDEPSDRSYASKGRLESPSSGENSSNKNSAKDVASFTHVQAATEPLTGSPTEHKGSPQGSEASSTGLRSSLAVIKRTISVDRIVTIISLGSNSGNGYAKARGDRPGGITQEIPGSFASSSLSGGSEPAQSAQFHDNDHFRPTISVDIGEVQILSDMGLMRMMILLIQKFNALRRPLTPEPNNSKTSKSTQSHQKELKLTLKKARWKFLDAVKGAHLLNFHRNLRVFGTQPFSEDSEVLLRLDIDIFDAVCSRSDTTSITKVSMGKLAFGYCSDDILSFDSGLRMRESTRDVLAPVNNDIIMTLTQNRGTLVVDLTTLPLHVVLDLRRLDETFNWFGGFSSMLGLGNSMVSTMTIVDVKTRTTSSGKSTRGVHFESLDTDKPLYPGPTRNQNKITARIGGVVLELQGTQSSLRLEGTAMKVVSRVEGLGLQVDRLKFSGPHLKHGIDEPSVSVQIASLRVEYLSIPKEIDLTRLLALLSPSKDKDARDDDILLETLLRQRRQGAVVRTTIESLEGKVSSLEDLHCFPLLAEDLKKLSTVAKYLPEDDRPGILVLGLVKDFRVAFTINDSFGVGSLTGRNIEGAHVTFPTLMVMGINALYVHRNGIEELVGAVLPPDVNTESDMPVVMAQFVGNALEPTAKIKIRNLRLEYYVSTIMGILGLDEAPNTEAMLAEMIRSVATITSRHNSQPPPPKNSGQSLTSSDNPASSSKTLKLDISIRDSIVGLNPRHASAKALLVFTDAHVLVSRPRAEEAKALLQIRKASIMVIDDIDNVTPIGNKSNEKKSFRIKRTQVESLSDMGYVSVGFISAANATVRIVDIKAEDGKAIDVVIRDNLFVLETCADSTQTLQNILDGLKPPRLPSTEKKYMTEVVPIEDMLASFTGDAFTTTASEAEEANDLPLGLDEGDMVDDEVPQNLEFVSSFYNPEPDSVYDGIANSMLEDDLESLASPNSVREIGDRNLLESFQDQTQIAPGNVPLDIQEDHFGSSSAVGNRAHTWNTKSSAYKSSKGDIPRASPLRVRVRDVHIIWHLFDGYDWQHTRDTITQAVEDVQNRATERLARKDKRNSVDPEEEEESVIGDFLFNSIYIGIPANRDPGDLARQVNRNLDDLVSESESYATSASSGSPSRPGRLPRLKARKLRLQRSRYHKITFELKGVSADMIVLPPGSGEAQSSIDVRIQELEVFDHVPTSTWKKFATYMHDAGERQSGTSMVHLEILNVKPVPHLAASELILKVSSK